MRTVVLSSIFALLLAVSAFSQSTSPCGDPTIVPTGDTLTASVSVGGNLSVAGGKKILVTGKKVKNNGQYTWEICIWRNGTTGQNTYSILPSTISYTGDPMVIDGMKTSEIFDLLAQTSIEQLVAQGLIPCTLDCGSGANLAQLYTVACVQRTGKGPSTQFLPCDALSCCTRYYSVCCPYGPGTPVIQLVSSQSSGCTAGVGCESTCPQ
jgi:hypothetical protein